MALKILILSTCLVGGWHIGNFVGKISIRIYEKITNKEREDK